MKVLALLVLPAFLVSCHVSQPIKEMWNYRNGEEILSINLGTSRDDISNEEISCCVLYQSIYDCDGKCSGRKSFIGQWRYEEDILTVFEIVEGVEKIQVKCKVLEIARGSSMKVTVLEVHDALMPMGLVGKTILMIKPAPVDNSYNRGGWGC